MPLLKPLTKWYNSCTLQTLLNNEILSTNQKEKVTIPQNHNIQLKKKKLSRYFCLQNPTGIYFCPQYIYHKSKRKFAVKLFIHINMGRTFLSSQKVIYSPCVEKITFQKF